MSAGAVRLRDATAADADRLLGWRTEPATAAASFTGGKIDPDEHRAWLARTLADAGVALLIVEVDGEPVGQVRLARLDLGTAEVHVGLTAHVHGRGLGRRALEAAAGEARTRLGVERLVARVRPDNDASLRAFAAAGFARVEASEELVVLDRAV